MPRLPPPPRTYVPNRLFRMFSGTCGPVFVTEMRALSASSITRGITIKIECAPELEARFDTALVERVLHNLVGNASRYCNQGGSIVVAAVPLNDADSARITVTNTGPQVPENIRSNLFGKYVRGGGGKRGMGLYFCRLVAEAHGGRIEYEAAAQGPCFVLSLPGRA